MKIISDFVDFYDACQDNHINEESSIVYMRKTHEVDWFSATEVQSAIDTSNLKHFSDKILNPNWKITPFIIGASGRFNKGIEIIKDGQVDYSYTLTGSYYIPSKMGIEMSGELIEYLKEHFDNSVFDNADVFKTVGSPAFVIVPQFFVTDHIGDDLNRVTINHLGTESNHRVGAEVL